MSYGYIGYSVRRQVGDGRLTRLRGPKAIGSWGPTDLLYFDLAVSDVGYYSPPPPAAALRAFRVSAPFTAARWRLRAATRLAASAR